MYDTVPKTFISHVRQLGKNTRELIHDRNDYDETYLINHPLRILSAHVITPAFILIKSDNGTELLKYIYDRLTRRLYNSAGILASYISSERYSRA